MIRWVMLVAALLAVTPAYAQMTVVPKDTSRPPSEAVPPNVSANQILPYCVTDEQVPPNHQYETQGFCSGSIYTLMIALNEFKGACIPQGVSVDQAKRVVVRYVSARPERMHEYFLNLASEALRDAWPCKQ
jgi:hypothetical protein